MKILKSFKYIYLSIVVLVCSFNFSAFTSYASVSNDRIVQARTSTFGSLDYSYQFHEKYFTVANSSSIPKSTTLNPVFYYNVGSNTFDYISSSDLVMTVFNRGLGIIFNPDQASPIIRAFLASMSNSIDNSFFIQGALYDSNTNEFLGYCLDDISGRYYVNTPAETLTVPSEFVNNVYNFFNYYTNDTVYAADCDYFTFICPSRSDLVLNSAYAGNSSSYQYLNNQNSNNVFDDSITYQECFYTDSGFKIGCFYEGEYEDLSTFPVSSNYHFLPGDDVVWNNFVSHYNLYTGSTLSYNELILDSSVGMWYRAYDSNGDIANLSLKYFNPNLHYSTSDYYFSLGNALNGVTMPFNGSITIFRSEAVYQKFIGNDIDNNYLFGDTYYDYSVTNNNSFTTSINNINNSTTINNNLYDEGKTIIVDNTDDNTIDTDQIHIDITVIIDNIYDDPDGGGGSNPDNPDNPDDDHPILETLLEKIVDFLDAVGAVIGAVITGLLGLFTNVINALTGITGLITSVGSFMGSIFDFLPSDLVAVIVAALSLCILAAVIKFIRG